MFRRPSKKQMLIRRVIVYAVMTLAVLVIVTGSILFILGYRLDSDKGRFEQGSLVQFESVPSGASVAIDGDYLGGRTPAKQTIIAGIHSFLVTRDGYETWAKSLTVKAGTLTWLDYIRLVPKVLEPETVGSYDAVYGEKASPDYKKIIVQEKASEPVFDLVDISAQQVKSSKITLPPSVYSEATNSKTKHNFTLDQWDDGGRYVLAKHDYSGKSEWIVIDTEDIASSVNVTRLLDISLSDIQFSGTNGNILFGLIDGVIRKLDLRSETISRVLVSNVKSFEMFETSVLSYVGTDPSNSSKQVAGVYRDGDDSSHVLRTVDSLKTPLRIDTARYYSDDYVAIAEGLKITVLKGRYPTSSQDEPTSLKKVAEFRVATNVDDLSFSPAGDYLIAQSGLTFLGYEVEYDRATKASVDTKDTEPRNFAWLDDAYLWTVYDGRLSIREFDGTNAHEIMSMQPRFDATLSQNGRYIYGITKSSDGYHLQRVRMILD